jgi:hypothetical protein
VVLKTSAARSTLVSLFFQHARIRIPVTRLGPWPTALLKRVWVTEAATTTFIPATLRNIWTEAEYTHAMCRAIHGALIKRMQTKYMSPKLDQFQARF